MSSVAMIMKEKALDVFVKSYDPLSMNRKSLEKIKHNEIV